LRLTGQIVLFAALTVGYWALLTFVPYNGRRAERCNRSNNFAAYRSAGADVFAGIIPSPGGHQPRFSASVLLGRWPAT